MISVLKLDTHFLFLVYTFKNYYCCSLNPFVFQSVLILEILEHGLKVLNIIAIVVLFHLLIS